MKNLSIFFSTIENILMSLFLVNSDYYNDIICPISINIEGEIIGSIFSGNIAMKFRNDTDVIDNYKVLIGRNPNNKIVLYNFNVNLGMNQFVILIDEDNHFYHDFNKTPDFYQPTKYKEGHDSISDFKINDILPNQVLTVSANFVIPITYQSPNNINIYFPLTCPTRQNAKIINCTNFNFSCNFKTLEKVNSITSNPDGTIDHSNYIYKIDHINPSLTNISIEFNMNTSLLTQNKIFNENGISTFCDNYGFISFIPPMTTKDDHSGEEFIFIVDCSWSIQNEVELISQSLKFFIKSLPANCYFNVICYGSEIDPLFENSIEYSNENIEKALKLSNSLTAKMGLADLLKPLSYVFSKPKVNSDKLRRIFISTSGFRENTNEIIEIVKQNSFNSICNVVGIGYCINKSTLTKIAEVGNGFVDFVLSGDDLCSKIVNQLTQNLNGSLDVNIKIENRDDLEIYPTVTKLSPGIPSTFFFKSENEFTEDTKIKIDFFGKRETLIIKPNYVYHDKMLHFNMKILFINENIKELRQMIQTSEVIYQITQLSLENGLLSPYTKFIGERIFISEEQKESYLNYIQDIKQKESSSKNGVSVPKNHLVINTLANHRIVVPYDINDKISDIRKRIYDKEEYVYYKLYYNKVELKDEEKTLSDYSFDNKFPLQMIFRLIGGPYDYPRRTFNLINCNDAFAIAAEQSIEGYWNDIPEFIQNEMKDINQKASDLCKRKEFDVNERKIISTIVCLFYLKMHQKDSYKMWHLIYEKGINWLRSFDSSILSDELTSNL